jgi:hypothetical protein
MRHASDSFMHLRRLSWIAAVLLGALPAGALPIKTALEAGAVVISGATPNGQVVVFGVTREVGEDDFHTVRRHLAVLTDDDGDGTVRYAVEEGVPLRSLWSAADLASGDYATAAPEGYELRKADWKGDGLKRLGGKDTLEDRRSLLELLVVRAGEGAWAKQVTDGGESDADGLVDGRLEGVLDQMTPLASSPPSPSVFLENDLVLAIDPDAMEIILVKVPAP